MFREIISYFKWLFYYVSLEILNLADSAVSTSGLRSLLFDFDSSWGIESITDVIIIVFGPVDLLCMLIFCLLLLTELIYTFA